MQQINLYLPELRPQKEWLTANSIALSMLGFALLMILASYFLNKDIERFEARIELIEKQRTIIEFRIKETQRTPHTINMNTLENTSKKLKQKVLAREQIGDLIQSQNLGNDLGFSSAMAGFSRQSFPSIALDHIRISRGGSFVELKGKTSIVENIPNFIRKLKQESSFKGSRFGLISILDNEKSLHHDFTLGFESVYQLTAHEADE